jgi:hypothetical protein
VVVVGTTTGAVVVVTGAAAGGPVVVGTVAPCVDVSAVAAVLAFAPTGAVVVVDCAVDADRVEPPAAARAPRASLDCAFTIPCAPRAACFGLPAVATSSAIRARDTARMTHQLGRPRTTLGRRPSEDLVP